MMTTIPASIDRALRNGMRHEGWANGTAALINRPADRGGLTRGGVRAVNWGAHLGLGRPATSSELLAMTEAGALDYFYADFVQRPGFDKLLDERLCALMIDWAFTSWTDDPIRALQDSLRRRGLYTGALDGILGPLALAALAADRDPNQTYRDVLAARVRFYRNIAFDDAVLAFLQRTPATQLHNLGGWLQRTLDFLP